MNNQQIAQWGEDTTRNRQFAGKTQRGLLKIAEGRSQHLTREIKGALRELEQEAMVANYESPKVSTDDKNQMLLNHGQ